MHNSAWMKKFADRWRCWVDNYLTYNMDKSCCIWASARCFRLFCIISTLFFLCLFTISCSSPPVPRVYKIGLVAPFEGAYRDIGYDAIYAARLAVREINTFSVSQGWALELVAYDDRAEPNMARTSARNLVTDTDVLAVIGHYTNGTTTAASNTYIAAGLPLLVIGGGPESPTLWHLAPPPQQQIAVMLKIYGESTSIAAVWGEDALASELHKQLAARKVDVMDTRSELTSTLPDTIFSTLPPLQTAEYLTLWSKDGWHGRLLTTNFLHTSDLTRMSSEWLKRACIITPYPSPDDLDDLEIWKAAYTNTGPHVPEPGPYALPTYDIIYLIAEVIAKGFEQNTPLNRQYINAALEHVRFAGKLGDIIWDEDGYWDSAPLYHYCGEQVTQLVEIIR